MTEKSTHFTDKDWTKLKVAIFTMVAIAGYFLGVILFNV